MRQTRRSQISHRIFTIDDLKRIAGVFHKQAELARRSNHHYSVEYNLHFADGTSFESDTPEVLDDIAVQIKRPVRVTFDFWNYALGRRLAFAITHGESDYGNEFWVRAEELTWLNDNFARLEEFVNGARPQSFFFARHPNVLRNLLAVGIGSLGMLLMEFVVSFWNVQQVSSDSGGGAPRTWGLSSSQSGLAWPLLVDLEMGCRLVLGCHSCCQLAPISLAKHRSQFRG